MKTKHALLATLFTTSCFAGFVSQTTPAPQKITTAQSIALLADDTTVELEGFLLQKTGLKTYLFKDQSGQITVEIKSKIFQGLEVSPTTKIKICGEVDKERNSTKVEVDYLEIIGQKTPLTPVQSVSTLKEDTVITLEGFIIQKLSDDDYLFKDSSGQIQIEIDSKTFQGLEVSPTTKVQITGEVEKEDGINQIEVSYLKRIP